MNLNQQRRAHTETELQPERTCETAQTIPDCLVVVVLERQKSLRRDEAKQTKKKERKKKG